MKKIYYLLICFLVFHQALHAQSITEIEYFLDEDPGFANGTEVPVTAGRDITANFTVEVANESDGFHILYIRAKDDNGDWSLNYTKPIFINPSSSDQVVVLEYYFDTDPGFGQGIDVPITPGSDVHESFMVDLTTVENGFHILYVRAQDEDGVWSLNYTAPIFKESISSVDRIVKLEYYVDTDPGKGNGTDVPIISEMDISKYFIVDLNHVSEGFHTLYIRAQDSNNAWSIAHTHIFNKTSGSGTNMNIQGNGVSILNGDTSPSSDDHTDFGISLLGTPRDRVFTIQNTGSTPLTISTPITVIGTEFLTIKEPQRAVPGGGATTFTIRFYPTSSNEVNGSISIASNHFVSPFTFAIKGRGTTQTKTCLGDCDGSSDVSFSEIQTAVNQYLGTDGVDACNDGNDDGTVSISEVQGVVNNYLQGCGSSD